MIHVSHDFLLLHSNCPVYIFPMSFHRSFPRCTAPMDRKKMTNLFRSNRNRRSNYGAFEAWRNFQSQCEPICGHPCSTRLKAFFERNVLPFGDLTSDTIPRSYSYIIRVVCYGESRISCPLQRRPPQTTDTNVCQKYRSWDVTILSTFKEALSQR
jgi:hypothetical protein